MAFENKEDRVQDNHQNYEESWWKTGVRS